MKHLINFIGSSICFLVIGLFVAAILITPQDRFYRTPAAFWSQVWRDVTE
jgi:hypothetical protein